MIRFPPCDLFPPLILTQIVPMHFNMTAISPKTIVVTTIPAKRLISSVSPIIKIEDDDDDDDDMEIGPRKRRRLTHLTPEERMLRRKLKNRVAAQTARDRKKQRMDELEDIVTKLESENKRLARENTTLRTQTDNLSTENEALKQHLGLDVGSEAETERHGPSSGSAAPQPPLQQELVRALRLTPAPQIALLLFSLMPFLDSFNTLLKVQGKMGMREVRNLLQLLKSPESPLLENQKVNMPWWGPHQQSWSPSKN